MNLSFEEITFSKVFQSGLNTLLILVCLFPVEILSQQVEIQGKTKIAIVENYNNSDSIVVIQGNGILAWREMSTMIEHQIISISNDTIYLTNGGFIKLPSDKVEDADADPSNEIQNLSQVLSINNDAAGAKITGLMNPVSDQDAATKAYIDAIINSMQHVGDLKYSLKAIDHSGWYLLNGRDINSLPPNAKAAALSLGYNSNLPNMVGRFIKHREGTDIVGQLYGSNSIVLNSQNLPNYNLPLARTSSDTHNHRVTGNTKTDGIHAHTYRDYHYIDSGFNASYATPDGDAVGQLTYADRTTATTGSEHYHAVDIFSSYETHDHTVTVNSGGSGLPIKFSPPNMAAYSFIYLGQ